MQSQDYATVSSSPATAAAAVVNESSSTRGDGDGGLDLVAALWIFGAPAIFVVGVTGNALVLVVMTRRRMSGTSTSMHLSVMAVGDMVVHLSSDMVVYLSVMAVADIVVLVSGLVPDWLEALTAGDIVFKKLHPATCKLEKFIFFTRYNNRSFIHSFNSGPEIAVGLIEKFKV